MSDLQSQCLGRHTSYGDSTLLYLQLCSGLERGARKMGTLAIVVEPPIAWLHDLKYPGSIHSG